MNASAMTPPTLDAAWRIRLVIADDHPLVREGLRARLAAVPYIEVIADTCNAEQTLAVMAASPPDLLLADISMPGMNGIELATRVRTLYPQVRVLVLSMYNHREYVLAAVRAGAVAYVLKDAPLDEIIAAIDAVWAGGTYYSTAVAATAFGVAAQAPHLTGRELEVLLLLAHGSSNKLVARKLDISVRTVESHRLSLRRKLGVDSPAELLKMAVAYGWTTL